MKGKRRIQKTEDAVLAKVEWCSIRVMQVAWDKKKQLTVFAENYYRVPHYCKCILAPISAQIVK